MKTNSCNCILVGLPGSGKSTFVGALWHAIESDEMDLPFNITTLDGNQGYLNGLRDSWLKCQPVERTKPPFQHDIRLNIRHKIQGIEKKLLFPDVAGEMYREQFESRKISDEYLDSLEHVDGILLFINPNSVKKPILISEVAYVLREESQSQSEEIKEWNHRDCPDQVVLVDLLQMILFKTSHSCKISVVISAWDEIKDCPDKKHSQLSPGEWVMYGMPLLYQFLESHFDNERFKAFGISAQGAEYDTTNEKLLQFNKPTERIFVRTEVDETHDITLPISWILLR